MISKIAFILKETVVLTIIFVCLLLVLNHYEIAYSLFLGSALSILNLFLIKKIMESSLMPSVPLIPIITIVALKFPLLYLIGYFLFTSFSPVFLLIGMSIIFIPITKALAIKAVQSC